MTDGKKIKWDSAYLSFHSGEGLQGHAQGRRSQKGSVTTLCEKIELMLLFGYKIIIHQFSQFSHSVMSDSMWRHGLQHTRLHNAYGGSITYIEKIHDNYNTKYSSERNRIIQFYRKKMKINLSLTIVIINLDANSQTFQLKGKHRQTACKAWLNQMLCETDVC